MSLDRTPLPRLWYLPRGEKAAVVLTGDDHGNGGTAGQFDRFGAASPPGCSVADWECVRATSYLYPGGPLSDAQARGLPGGRLRAGAAPADVLRGPDAGDAGRALVAALAAFAAAWPSLRAPRTSRSHCTTWSDWVGEPLAERVHGIRFDTNYYYFPANWVLDRPGLFTGSGMPMRFADADGSLIDVYQATTQLTDETLLDPPGARGAAARRHIAALLDAALGAEGFHGVFTANMHTDDSVHGGADAIVQEALARGVPVVSSEQMLDWLDGRNETRFAGLAAEGGRVRFTLQPAPGARGLQAMVPARSADGALTGVTRDGAAVATRRVLVKGVEYGMFDGLPGAYVATYRPGPPEPRPPGELSGSARKAPAALRVPNAPARVAPRQGPRARRLPRRRAPVPGDDHAPPPRPPRRSPARDRGGRLRPHRGGPALRARAAQARGARPAAAAGGAQDAPRRAGADGHAPRDRPRPAAEVIRGLGERLADGVEDAIGLERLDDEVLRAELDRLEHLGLLARAPST